MLRVYFIVVLYRYYIQYIKENKSTYILRICIMAQEFIQIHNNTLYFGQVVILIIYNLYNMLLYNLYFGQIVILIIYNVCLSVVDAEQHRITRATVKQKVEEGDESEIANMTTKFKFLALYRSNASVPPYTIFWVSFVGTG